MKKIYYLAPVVAMAILVACGSDTPDGPNGGNGQGEQGGQQSGSADEDKEYVEDVARQFGGYFRTQDQKEAIDLANDFSNLYADFDIPREWEDLDSRGSYRSAAPGKFFRSVKQGLESGDVTALTRSAYYYNYSITSISGVYEPDTRLGRWVKTSGSNDLVFRFRDSWNNSCELKVSGNGGEYPVEYEDYDSYRVNVPRTIIAELSQGGKAMFKSTVNSAYTPSSLLEFKADMTLCNLQLVSATQVNSGKATQTTSLMSGGRLVVTTSAEASGRSLLDIDSYEDDNTASKLTSGTAESSILGQITVKANVTQLQKVVDAFDLYYYYQYYHWGDYTNVHTNCDDRAQAERELERGAATVNTYLKADLYFGNEKKGNFVSRPYFEEWGESNYDGWIEPYLQFNDGSLYGAGAEDAENFFDGPITVFNELYEAYERVLRFL